MKGMALNVECYLVTGGLDSATDVVITEQFEDVIDYLKQLQPEEHYETMVLHGFLSPADVLPSDLAGRECYILVLNPSCGIDGVGLRGALFEVDTADEVDTLAEEIEEIINLDARGLLFAPEIEDIYVFYGYQATLGICVNEDDIEEENINRCKKVIEETTVIRRSSA